MTEADSCILFRKYYKWKLEIVMSVHVDGVFMAGNIETWKNTKGNIKGKLNISGSGKVKKFLEVYYKWSREAKGTYAKTTTEKDTKKLVEGYRKYTGSDVKAQKTPGYPETTLSKINLEETYNIDKYISFVGQLMWYATKVVPEVANTENTANAERKLAVHISNPGTEYWKELVRLIGYLKGKETKVIVIINPKVLKSGMFCDSNYATYKETRNSVSGLVATLTGTLLTCSSKTQRYVTLISTKAKCLELSECS